MATCRWLFQALADLETTETAGSSQGTGRWPNLTGFFTVLDGVSGQYSPRNLQQDLLNGPPNLRVELLRGPLVRSHSIFDGYSQFRFFLRYSWSGYFLGIFCLPRKPSQTRDSKITKIYIHSRGMLGFVGANDCRRSTLQPAGGPWSSTGYPILKNSYCYNNWKFQPLDAND